MMGASAIRLIASCRKSRNVDHDACSRELLTCNTMARGGYGVTPPDIGGNAGWKVFRSGGLMVD